MTTAKIQLPTITLIALTGLYYQTEAHQKAIEKSCEGIDFGAVKVICDAGIKTVDDWKWKKDRQETAETIKEIERKKERTAPLFNKGGYQYITDAEDPKTIGRKI